MKADIHPEYHKTSIQCACGNVLEVGSTKADIRVEICSQCHPFFTGKQKLVDTAGRIERFRKKYEKFQQQKEKPNEQPPPAIMLLSSRAFVYRAHTGLAAIRHTVAVLAS